MRIVSKHHPFHTNKRPNKPKDDYLVSYLNRKEVKAALHVKEEIGWEECSTTVRYDVQDLLVPMEVGASGRVDGCVCV